MDRRFPIENGAQVITCGGCGRKDEAGRNGGKAGGNLPPVAIARFFSQRGWRVGATPRKDRCPDCLNPKRNTKEETELSTKLTVIDQIRPPKPGASEEPPRQMSREDRRLIFAKLEEVYVDERVGYAAGWNDEKVAKDMAVPRAWVEVIRDENFGPQKAEQSAEVIDLRERIEKAEREGAALADDAGAIRKAAEGAALAAAKIEGRARDLLKGVETLRDDLRKLTGVR